MENRANPENCRLLNRKYLATEKGKIAREKSTNKYKKSNLLKIKAQGVLAYAIKMKRIIKTPCLVCGAEKVEGHHPDYSRPLDVVWLCNPHHRGAHSLVTQP